MNYSLMFIEGESYDDAVPLEYLTQYVKGLSDSRSCVELTRTTSGSAIELKLVNMIKRKWKCS